MDLELVTKATDDISERLAARVASAKTGDRIILSPAQANALCATIDELAEESDNSIGKPKFFHVRNQTEFYFQPAAVAVVLLDPKTGNAVVNLVNGGNLIVEALQWRLMRESFESAVDLEEIRSTSGMVSA